MTPTPTERPMPVVRHQLLAALALAVLTAGLWFAWMGWDTTYETDPVTLEESGPYEVWQVIGCATSLLVVFVGALVMRVRPVVACVAVTVAFTAAWTVTAATSDESGLFVIGAILTLVGLAVATALVSVLALGLMRRWGPQRRP